MTLVVACCACRPLLPLPSPQNTHIHTQRVKEMTAKGLDYKKEMAKLKAAKAAAKAKAAAAAAKA